MAGERTFLVRILGNADSAVTAFKKLGKEGSDALGQVFDVAKKGALIATATAGAIAGAAFSAVKAATEDQESQKKLADQLRRTMEATDEQIASVEQYISKQQMLVGVTDDQLRPALANLARATGDITFAQKNLHFVLIKLFRDNLDQIIVATLPRYFVYRDWETDRKSTRLNSSHLKLSRMPSSA